jgi:hypothetical protein
MSDFPARSVSSQRSSVWDAVSSRMPRSSRTRTAGRVISASRLRPSRRKIPDFVVRRRPPGHVIVVSDAGEILMIRRTDNDSWAVPGGAVDLGEPSPKRRSAKRARSRESSTRSPASRGSAPPQARHPLHQQRRGPAGVPYRADRAALEGRTANAEQRVKRGPCVPLSPGTRWTSQCASASTTTCHVTTHRWSSSTTMLAAPNPAVRNGRPPGPGACASP